MHIRLPFTKSYIFLADHTDKKYQLKLGPEACLAVTIAHRYYECSQGHDRQTTIKKSCMVCHIFHGYYSFFSYYQIIYPSNIYALLPH